MEQQNFNISIDVPMPAAQITQKIADVPDWWGVGFEGNAKKQGDKFVIKMGPEAFFNCTVTAYAEGQRIIWLVDECYMPWYNDKTEWTGTKMIFDLEESGNQTKVTFTHEGLTPRSECYKDCQPGWTHWISRSLMSYLTTGTGDFKQR